MDLSAEETAALHALKSQYFQLVEPRLIAFPPASLLARAHFQAALYHALFAPSASAHPPTERYAARVLKPLLALLEDACAPVDGEVDGDLLELYTSLLQLPRGVEDPTRPCSVSYTLPPPLAPVALVETPQLISGLGTTGLRTWEAALALCELLLARSVPVDADTRVLELGAGTGAVALVAARLGVRNVLATDGDEGVCEALVANVRRNGLEGQVRVQKRMWAGPRECPEKVDLVLGADVVSDPSPVERDSADMEHRPMMVKRFRFWWQNLCGSLKRIPG